MNIEPVWDEYRAGIKAFLHSKISNAADVDDLLQDILIKTYENLHRVESDSSLKSWLFQIANHTVIDFYRSKGRKQEPEAADLWFEEDSTDIKEALSQCLQPFIDSLPTESAKLLTSIDIKGQSQKDCAKELGISYSTLKSRVQKGRSQLRKLYEDCCYLSFDRQGTVMDFDSKSGSCKKC